MSPADVMRLPAEKRTRYKAVLRGPRYRPQRYVVHAKDFMSTQNLNTAGALTPFYVVARAAGLETWALQKLVPDGFLTNPKFCVPGPVTQITPEGVAELAQVVERRGYAVMAHSLRVLARDKRETPSRALVTEPVAKDGAVPHFAWQERKDING